MARAISLVIVGITLAIEGILLGYLFGHPTLLRTLELSSFSLAWALLVFLAVPVVIVLTFLRWDRINQELKALLGIGFGPALFLAGVALGLF